MSATAGPATVESIDPANGELVETYEVFTEGQIDAALDLSHTQNIGQMLKAHFTHSQFIIVSLKEGMFSNANVLFQTKFVDGVSTVSRTIPNKEKGAYREKDKENVRPKQK